MQFYTAFVSNTSWIGCWFFGCMWWVFTFYVFVYCSVVFVSPVDIEVKLHGWYGIGDRAKRTKKNSKFRVEEFAFHDISAPSVSLISYLSTFYLLLNTLSRFVESYNLFSCMHICQLFIFC